MQGVTSVHVLGLTCANFSFCDHIISKQQSNLKTFICPDSFSSQVDMQKEITPAVVNAIKIIVELKMKIGSKNPLVPRQKYVFMRVFLVMNLKDNSQLDSPVDYCRGYISMKPILVN